MCHHWMRRYHYSLPIRSPLHRLYDTSFFSCFISSMSLHAWASLPQFLCSPFGSNFIPSSLAHTWSCWNKPQLPTSAWGLSSVFHHLETIWARFAKPTQARSTSWLLDDLPFCFLWQWFSFSCCSWILNKRTVLTWCFAVIVLFVAFLGVSLTRDHHCLFGIWKRKAEGRKKNILRREMVRKDYEPCTWSTASLCDVSLIKYQVYSVIPLLLLRCIFIDR